VVAVLDIIGDIDFSSSQQQLHQLRQAASQHRIGVLVLRINSTGGSVAAAQQLCEGIDALRETGVHVLACCGDVTKSAALYIAASAHQVLAQAGTMTGNVGAVMRHASLSAFGARFGVEDVVVASGAFKDPTRLASAPSPHELEVMQALVSAVHGQFCDWLMQRRQIAPATIELLADGRIVTGAEALKLGLIDELGGYWRVLTLAADHLKQPNPAIVHLNQSEPGRLPWYAALLPEPLKRVYRLLNRGY
jgi:protease-4